nr:hypothetical protein CFP56_65082 [Quercus suber]
MLLPGISPKNMLLGMDKVLSWVRFAMEAESVPERAESLAKVLVRFKEMTLSLWQVMPYQWQWLVDGVHVERRLEGSRVMEFLKLRRDNASLGKRIEEVMRGGLVKEEKKKIRSHGRGIVIIVVK